MLIKFARRTLKPRRLSCGQVQQRLLAYTRNDMSIAEIQMIQRHLDNCDLCLGQLIELEALEEELYSAAARSYPVLDPVTQKHIHHHLMQTLHKGVFMARLTQAIRKSVRLGGLAGGMLLMLAIVYYMLLSLTPDLPPSTPIAPPDKAGLGEQIEVITFGAYEATQPYYERVIEQFNQQSADIHVQFIPLPAARFSDTHTLASAADVVLVPFGLTSEMYVYFRDLQPLLDSDLDFAPSDFWPGILDGCRDAGGRLVGIPLYASLGGVYYEREAFKAAGMEYPRPGWTLVDFIEAVQYLARHEENSTRYGLADNLHLSTSILRPYIEAYLIPGTIDNPGDLAMRMAKELEWYMDLTQSGAILPIGSQQGEWEALFTTGNPPAMWVGQLGQYMPGSSTGFSPQQPLEGLAISQYGFAPYPAGESSSASNMTPFSPACAIISTGSQDPLRSWDLVEYLSHQEHIENQGLGSQILRIPARQSVAETGGFFDRLPNEQKAAVRYALEQLRPGTHSSQALSVLHEALMLALSGSAGLTDALVNGLAELTNEPGAPMETQEIVIATPQPTTRPGQTSARFFFLALSEGEKMALTTLGQTYNQAHPETFVRIIFTYDLPQDLNFTRGFDEQFDCYAWYSPAFFDPDQVDYMRPLDPLLEAEPVTFIQDFFPEQLNLYRSDGRLYGLPASSQPEVMFYNTDLLRKRGIPIPDIDWTYQDFLDLIQAVSSQDPGDPSYGYLFDEWENLFEYYYQVEWSEGHDVAEPRAFFDSPQVLGYLSWLSDLRKANVLFVKYDSEFFPAWQAFEEGKIAFWTAPAGDPFVYYFADSMDPPYEIGVLPLPAPPGGGKYYGGPTSRGYFISPSSANPQLCWDWIKFLSEQPNAIEGVPARPSVATSPAWTALVGENEAAAYRQALSQYESVPLEHVGGAYYKWRHDAMRAALSGASLESLLADLQVKADRYLACMIEAGASQMDYPEVVGVRENCVAEAESMEE